MKKKCIIMMTNQSKLEVELEMETVEAFAEEYLKRDCIIVKGKNTLILVGKYISSIEINDIPDKEPT